MFFNSPKIIFKGRLKLRASKFNGSSTYTELHNCNTTQEWKNRNCFFKIAVEILSDTNKFILVTRFLEENAAEKLH